MLQRWLQGMPTRPVLYIAPLAAVAVLALYYYGRYRDCHFQASLRQDAYRLAAARRDGVMNLAEAVPFSWDRAIVSRAGREAPDCPLGWDWPRGRRAELAAAQRLSAIVYLYRGRAAGYVELDRAVLDFDRDGEYAPREALFRTRQSGSGLLLSPARAAGAGEGDDPGGDRNQLSAPAPGDAGAPPGAEFPETRSSEDKDLHP
ncbi:MAG: hypothetical protein OXU61_13545 [Gammaproteobacteria bacterium]|nr:hypothetical protein [Gammaproteobacteria bacterium]